MHGNQWVLKIAVLKYYSVSKRGTTAKSNPKQATDPISLHTKFGDNSSNTFPRGVDIIKFSKCNSLQDTTDLLNSENLEVAIVQLTPAS